MTNTAASPDYSSAGLPRSPRLLDQLRREIRVRHYSRPTEEAYAQWVVRYVRFHERRHPSELGAEHVTAPSSQVDYVEVAT